MQFQSLIAATALAFAPALVARDALAQYPLPVTGPYVPAFSLVDSAIQSWAQTNGVKALTFALIYDKQLVYEQGYQLRSTRPPTARGGARSGAPR